MLKRNIGPLLCVICYIAMEKKAFYKGQLQKQRNDGGRSHIEVELFIVEFKEDDTYILFAPALEVYGYGDSLEEAKESFNVHLEEFFSYTEAKGTMRTELSRLGWEISGSRKKPKFAAPNFSKLISSNERLMSVMDNSEVTTHLTGVAVPA